MAEAEIGATDETLAPDSTLAAPNAPRPARDVIGRGTTLGRYVILRHVGAGGMGSVYEAFDPDLERKVAVKVLHREGRGRDLNDARTARILREARALAKLVHPNVVTVYDVGALDDGLFVAMELIDGVSLRRWIGSEARSQREILGAFVAAGRGLAAAHAAGIVHRDFKPDNAMVSPGGRVTVLDFGLATAGRSSPENARDSDPASASMSGDRLVDDLTATGTVMGTPAYMAPEQLRGDPADARADQFAFCVALYEALTGQRPFVADTLPALAAKVLAGRVDSLPAGARIPRWLAGPILRGLSVDPDGRWPAMDDLLAQLERRPLRRRVQLGVLGVGVGLLVAASGSQWFTEAQRVAACKENAHELDGVWDAEQREQVAGLHLPYADDRAAARLAALDRQLTDYRDAWLSVRERSCIAHVAATDPRNLCLDDARARFAALSTLLEQPESEEVIAGLAKLGSRLPAPDTCEADDVTRRFPMPDEGAERESVAEIRVVLARAQALSDADRTVEAFAASEDALERARALGYPPLLAEASLLHGQHSRASGRIDDAKSLTWEALAIAEKAQHRRIVAEAWASLVHLLGVELRRPAEALEIVPVARAAAELWGAEHNMLVLENNVGGAYYTAREWDTAVEHFERVLAGMEALYGPEDPSIVGYLNNLGAAEAARGNGEAAGEHFGRAVAIREAAFGSQHSSVAAVLNNLAALRLDAGDVESAIDLSKRALAIRERVYGPDHQETGTTLRLLAAAYYKADRYEEAVKFGQRSLDSLRRVYPADHPSVAMAQINLALSLGHMRRYEEAIALARACVASRRARASEPLKLASALHSLALILQWSEACDEALPLAREALEIARDNGPDEEIIADAQGVVAECT
jgi:tetratricopeptide (TPR) repeat protein